MWLKCDDMQTERAPLKERRTSKHMAACKDTTGAQRLQASGGNAREADGDEDLPIAILHKCAASACQAA